MVNAIWMDWISLNSTCDRNLKYVTFTEFNRMGSEEKKYNKKYRNVSVFYVTVQKTTENRSM